MLHRPIRSLSHMRQVLYVQLSVSIVLQLMAISQVLNGAKQTTYSDLYRLPSESEINRRVNHCLTNQADAGIWSSYIQNPVISFPKDVEHLDPMQTTVHVRGLVWGPWIHSEFSQRQRLLILEWLPLPGIFVNKETTMAPVPTTPIATSEMLVQVSSPLATFRPVTTPAPSFGSRASQGGNQKETKARI